MNGRALPVAGLLGAAAAMFWRPARLLVVGTLVFACWVIPLVLLAGAAPCGSARSLVPFGFVVDGWIERSIGADRGLFVAAIFLLFSSMVVLVLPCVWKIRSREAGSKGRSARLYRLRRQDSLLWTEGEAA